MRGLQCVTQGSKAARWAQRLVGSSLSASLCLQLRDTVSLLSIL